MAERPSKSRDQLVAEILQSEKTYVANLSTLQEIYVVPLLDDLNTPRPVLLPKKGQVILFLSNVEHMKTLNEKILSEIQSRVDSWSESSTLGDLFTQYAPLLRIYDQYAAAHEEVFRLIKYRADKTPELAELIRECESNPRSRGNNIQSLMIAPLLRAGEYLTNVRQLLAATPETHADHALLTKAVAILSSAVTHIDDAIRLERAKGAIQRLNNVWDRDFTKLGRDLIRTGPLLKVCRRADKEFQFILFSDCLVYGSAGVSGNTFHRSFDTTALKLEEVPSSANAMYAFKVINPEKSFVVKAKSQQEKMDWLVDINKCVAAASVGREDDEAFAAVWDQDASQKACPFCEAKFSISFRRHHCRRCGSVVCSNCSKKKLPLSRINKGQPDSTKMVRVCDRCFITCPRDNTAAAAALQSYAEAKAAQEAEGSPALPAASDAVTRRRSVIAPPPEAGAAPPPPAAAAITAEVLFDFAGQEESDLPLTAGAVVTVLEKEGEWWRGECSGAEGWFPANYVKQLPPPPPQQTRPAPPPPAASGGGDAAAPPPPPAAGGGAAAAEAESKGEEGAKEGEEEEPKKVFPKPVTQRDRVATEIMTTERTFVTNLRALDDVFVRPLTNDSNCIQPGIGRIVFETTTNNSMAVFFSNVEHMVTLNSTLLELIEERMMTWSAESTLGDLFVAFAPLFKMYSQYSRAFDFATKLCDTYAQKQAFGEFLTEAHTDPRLNNQQLQSFLIMPIQRLPRYVLLLKELLKRTDEGHADCEFIPRALADIKESADHVNDVIRERENREAIQELEKVWGGHRLATAGRMLVKQGPLVKQCRRTNKQFEFLLFNDAMVYGSSAIASGNTGLASVKFHREIDLSECHVIAVPPDQVPNAFSLASPNKSFVVMAANAAEMGEWYQAIEGCITAIREASGAAAVDIAPVWMPDAQQKQCTICNDKFNIYRRRHHCRKCGRVVCDSCSKGRMLLKNVAKKPVRVCDACQEDFASGRMSMVPGNSAASGAAAGASAAAAGVGAAASPRPQPSHPFSCDACSAGFDTAAELRTHHDSAHSAVTAARRRSSVRADRIAALGAGGVAAALAAQSSAAAFPYAATALYDHAASDANELALTAGMTLQITQANGEWLLAESADGMGWVPGNYVKRN